MKKTICLFLSFLMLITINPICASATMPDSRSDSDHTRNAIIVYQDNNIIIECTSESVSIPNAKIQPFSTTQTKTHSKTYNIKSKTGSVLASYTLTGTFSYNGKTSSCTQASCSTSIKNNTWQFTSKTASKSGNQALGSFTAECSSPSQTVSKSLTITCSKDGIIS